MSKKKLKYFVSYAHKDEKLALQLLDAFQEHAFLSKQYEFEQWIDHQIIVGEKWHEQIQNAIQASDFGMLLLSATYFNRKYIREKELSHYIQRGETEAVEVKIPIVPVGLKTFDLNADLLGLEATQIFRYKKAAGVDAKFYNELRSNARNAFSLQLLQAITQKMNAL
ncbi:MAG: toll/interleukin-1 receptor domain-containing protein [Bacteroidota bacterium]